MKSTEIKYIKSLKISAEDDNPSPQTASPTSLTTNQFDFFCHASKNFLLRINRGLDVNVY